MEALFRKYFWAIKALGMTAVAALAASAAVHYIAPDYILEVKDTTEAEGETDGETDGEEDEDEDDARSLLKKKRKKPARRGVSTGQAADEVRANNMFCPTCQPQEADPGLAGVVVDPDGKQVGGPMPGAVKSQLPLKLLATMESSDPEYSQATLLNMTSGGVAPVWPGDTIQNGVVVMSVERAIVHLRNGAQIEYLMIGEEPKVKKTTKKTKKKDDEEKPKKKKNSRAIPGAEDAIKCDDEGRSCTVERAFVEKILLNPAALAKQARVIPALKDGEPRGFKFYGIRSGSLPKLLKFKNGDLIMSVNGTDLKSIDGAMALYTKLRRASHLTVKIERKGKTLTKEINIQ